MKKLILFLSVFALVFTSCSSDDDASSNQDPFIGTWKYFKYIENGVEQPLDPCDTDETLIVTSDGQYVANFYAEVNGNCELDETLTGTWENAGGNLYVFNYDGFTDTDQLNFEGNTFYLEYIYDNGTPDDTSDDIIERDVYIKQ
nr:lipocalin family protein [uncultured Psychroserpens sp.]